MERNAKLVCGLGVSTLRLPLARALIYIVNRLQPARLPLQN